MRENSVNPRICITHPWVVKAQAEFAYLVHQLRSVGLDASYDSVEIREGDTLWDHVAPQIASDDIDGWAYVLTQRFMADRRCRDELMATLNRVCEEKGAGFPLAGLLFGIAPLSLPPVLRLRPCFHLADPNWQHQLRAAIRHLPSEQARREGSLHFNWRIHPSYGGDSSRTAVEVGPRSENIRCWRFAVPTSAALKQWGHGPSGGGEISPVRFSVVRGAGRLQNTEITWFGSEDSLSQAESAYAVFAGQLPDFVCFGRARTPEGPPGKMEIFHTGLTRQ